MLLERIRLNKRLIFYIVAAMHFAWGIGLLISSKPLLTTGISTIASFLHSFKLTGFVFLFAGLCGFIGVSKLFENTVNFFFFLPQQFLLMVSAICAVVCIYNGHFADGVIRSRDFIFVDQSALIALTIAHSVAFINNYMFKKMYV